MERGGGHKALQVFLKEFSMTWNQFLKTEGSECQNAVKWNVLFFLRSSNNSSTWIFY